MSLIALDAMGGDFAPRAPVEAALRAVRNEGMQVALVGRPEELEAELARQGSPTEGLSLVPAAEKVEISEAPTILLKEKKHTSIGVAFDQLAAGKAAAVVGAGHTGAMMVAGKHKLGALKGVERPAIATPLPLRRGTCLLLDSGANVDCRPAYLVQFARMGVQYARLINGLDQPRVGLLNIGTEPGKGNDLTRQAYPLLKAALPGFVGNLEPRDVFRGKADVVVCDGFVGNLVLKTAETVGAQMRLLVRDSTARSPMARLGAWLLQGVQGELLRRTDHREIGGSLILGVNGVAVVAHGASNARSLINAMRLARDCAEGGLVKALAAEFDSKTP